MNSRRALVWILASTMAACAAPEATRTSSAPAPLIVQEQGSFAVGGTILTAPGAFDPVAQGAYPPAGQDPQGQTLHGDVLEGGHSDLLD
jgi:hypothetical protein